MKSELIIFLAILANQIAFGFIISLRRRNNIVLMKSSNTEPFDVSITSTDSFSLEKDSSNHASSRATGEASGSGVASYYQEVLSLLAKVPFSE